LGVRTTAAVDGGLQFGLRQQEVTLGLDRRTKGCDLCLASVSNANTSTCMLLKRSCITGGPPSFQERRYLTSAAAARIKTMMTSDQTAPMPYIIPDVMPCIIMVHIT
jgi:hypothetical protein